VHVFPDFCRTICHLDIDDRNHSPGARHDQSGFAKRPQVKAG
jgi:hypothetical protein